MTPVLDTFVETYAKDLIISNFGEEARLYANEFKPNNDLLIRYQHFILDNLDLIQGKDIVDIGSNNGIWPVLMYLNGAKSVTCIEPRKKFVNGINNFAQQHSMPIFCIEGTHRDLGKLSKKKYDTVTMFAVDHFIEDIIQYLHQLKSFMSHTIIATDAINDLETKNTTKIEVSHNLYHRGGFHPTDNIIDDENGYQTTIEDFVSNPHKGRFVKFIRGYNFYETVADFLDITIINKSFYSVQQEEYWVYAFKL